MFRVARHVIKAVPGFRAFSTDYKDSIREFIRKCNSYAIRPVAPHLLSEQGKMLLQKYQEDKIAWEQLCAESPMELASFYRQLGDLKRRELKYKEAIEYYEHGFELAKDHAGSIRNGICVGLSLLYRDLGTPSNIRRAKELEKYIPHGLIVEREGGVGAGSEETCSFFKTTTGKTTVDGTKLELR